VPNSDTMIDIQDVSKNFGSIRAVDNVSMQIARGEFFSLLGPSGCGKTTLLRMLAGFGMPDAGEIFIDGQPMSDLPANRRPTNMVFQSYALFPHLTIRDNIAYGLIDRRLTRAETDKVVDQALHMIKLSGYGNRKATELSGGQRQRVALARALVCQPKVLLLDEPLGALDKKLREEMQLELRQIQKSVGITFVFVTHDQEEALTMSDRIAVMSKGRVLQIDTASGLYEDPNCREVAAFIGSMNFIDGRLLSTTQGNHLVDAGPYGQLQVRAREGQPMHGNVTIAVRPEKITLSETPFSSPRENVVKGKLAARAYLGDRNHYYVETAYTKTPIAVAQQNVTRDGRVGQLVGKDIWLSWNPDAAILLSAA
jgi:spermidine/putrescine ABC transporter ATP-binding subunit